MEAWLYRAEVHDCREAQVDLNQSAVGLPSQEDHLLMAIQRPVRVGRLEHQVEIFQADC